MGPPQGGSPVTDATGQPGVPEAAHGEQGPNTGRGTGSEPGDAAGRAADGGQDDGGGLSGRDDGRRAQLIAAAQAQWISTLTDLGGRNTLLYYKDRRAGTLDLAGADPDQLDRFCRTGSVRLTRLFSDADLRADAIRRVQAIYRKARELLEERGIRAAYLATGMARWDELFLEPAAPVLLRALTITPTRARHDDFDLTLDEEAEVNPVLLHKLATVFGAATEELAAERGGRLTRALYAAAAAAEVPGFEIGGRQVIGTFTYAKLPMVRDLEAAAELLGDSDVVAAIAGDIEAQELLNGEEAAGPVLDSPEQDYSVLDADSSQRSAINAVLSGHSLVIHGPPGTGKSQTIANLIAALVARGRKVLFVAEKRAAIDAVLTRLTAAELGDIVLDIHDGTKDRMRIARDLGGTLSLAEEAAKVPEPRAQRRLADRVHRLRRHSDALHAAHEPWQLSAYDVQSALLGLSEQARTPARLAAVEQIDAAVAETLRDELREFAHLGGFSLRPESNAWFGAAVRSAPEARTAWSLASRLATETLPKFGHLLGKVCAQTGLPAPASYQQQAFAMTLFAAVRVTSATLDADVWESSPGELASACGSGSSGPGLLERRRLRAQARSLWLGPDKPTLEDLHGALTVAAKQLAEWRELGGTGTPTVPAGYDEVAALYADIERQLAALRQVVPAGG